MLSEAERRLAQSVERAAPPALQLLGASGGRMQFKIPLDSTGTWIARSARATARKRAMPLDNLHALGEGDLLLGSLGSRSRLCAKLAIHRVAVMTRARSCPLSLLRQSIAQPL